MEATLTSSESFSQQLPSEGAAMAATSCSNMLLPPGFGAPPGLMHPRDMGLGGVGVAVATPPPGLAPPPGLEDVIPLKQERPLPVLLGRTKFPQQSMSMDCKASGCTKLPLLSTSTDCEASGRRTKLPQQSTSMDGKASERTQLPPLSTSGDWEASGHTQRRGTAAARGALHVAALIAQCSVTEELHPCMQLASAR